MKKSFRLLPYFLFLFLPSLCFGELTNLLPLEKRTETWSLVYLPSGASVVLKVEVAGDQFLRKFKLPLFQAPKDTTRLWLRPEFPVKVPNMSIFQRWRLKLNWMPLALPADPTQAPEEFGLVRQGNDGQVQVDWFSAKDWLYDKYEAGVVKLENQDYYRQVREAVHQSTPVIEENRPVMEWKGAIFPFPKTGDLSFELGKCELEYDLWRLE